MKPDYAFTAADYLKVLDAHGVHFGVIAGISIYGSYNDYMIDELRRQPRLRGTVNIDPATDRYTLERMKADGVVGVRLQLSRRKELPDLGNEMLSPAAAPRADLDWHVHLALEGRLLPAVLPALEASGVRVCWIISVIRIPGRVGKRGIPGAAAFGGQGPHVGEAFSWLSSDLAGPECRRA